MTTDELNTPTEYKTQTPTTWIHNPYIAAATSHNTRKAYRSDIRHFERWGGRLPATSDAVVNYLQAYATSINPRTLSRRLIAIKHWHTYQGFPDPTSHPVVNKTRIGIIRTHGKPKTKAYPLTPDDLYKIVKSLNQHPGLSACRDNALLQLGYFGALRRSELVNIHAEHIQWKNEGIEILLPQSKTDQNHEGQFSAIPYGSGELCPVKALKEWLQAAKITEGPIFRSIGRGGNLGLTALTPLSVNLILTNRANAAGLTDISSLSSHSLRRGLATSAARAGVPIHTIMQAGRWKQTNTVIEYIEASERFNQNAASSVLKSFDNSTTK